MASLAQLDATATYALKNYTEKPNWVNYTQIMRNWVYFQKIWKRAKETADGGQKLAWLVQKSAEDNVIYTEPHQQDPATLIQNNGVEASIDWSMQQTSYGWDMRESDLQGGPATRLVPILQERESTMWSKWYEFMETALWSLPAAGSSPVPLYGIPYWVVKNSSATPGFNGGAATGYTTVAAINPSTYTAHKNWTFTYTATTGITRTDLVRKVVEAMFKTRFMAPSPQVKGTDTTLPDRSLHCGWTIFSTLEELAEQRNDNLKKELGFMEGVLVIRQVPVMFTDALDGGRNADTTLTCYDSQTPFYGIDWNQFRYVAHDGAFQQRSDVMVNPANHMGRLVYVDNAGQYQCLRRDTNFVGYGV